MSYFKNADEIYHYIGGLFRSIGEDPKLNMIASKVQVAFRAEYSDPDATITVQFTPEGVKVTEGPSDIEVDVTTKMRADDANRFWRGEYNFVANVALGRAKMKGNPAKLMKMSPVQPLLIAKYKELISQKDG